VRAHSVLMALLFAAASVAAVGAEKTGDIVARADKLWVAGKLDDAQKAFEAAVKQEPKNSAVLLRLAGFQLSRQQIDKSIDTYRQIIGMEPKNSKAWIGMGLAYLHTSDDGLARASFEEAVRVDPERKAQLQPIFARLDERRN
jgi:cytochrome c-type biogenesis protein CcmH/NrfG